MKPTRHISRFVCFVCGVLLVSGILASHLVSGDALAEVTKKEPRVAFLSGSERSEQILREISATLKSIDTRLARLEKVVHQKP